MGFFNRKRRDEDEAGAAPDLSGLHPAAVEVIKGVGAHLDFINAVNTHITTHFGEPFGILRDSDRTEGIDMYVMPATEDVSHATIITSGMSRRPMQGAPPQATRAELVISLPADWPLASSALEDERHWWPFRLLQNISHLPHAHNTWLGVGHAIPHGDPPQPYADNTSLCGAMVLRPFFTPPGFNTLETDEHTVNFYGLFLLHADELQYKLDHTVEEFFDLLAQGGVTEIVNPARPSAV